MHIKYFSLFINVKSTRGPLVANKQHIFFMLILLNFALKTLSQNKKEGEIAKTKRAVLSNIRQNIKINGYHEVQDVSCFKWIDSPDF
jgi:hypothetical protein